MKKLPVFTLFFVILFHFSISWAADNPYIIYFDAFSSTPKSDSMKTLEAIKAKISKNPELRVVIEGYTDVKEIKQGEKNPENYPYELSRQRANYVSNWLTSAVGRFVTNEMKSLGNLRPVRDSNTYNGSAQNRRVEVKLLAKDNKVVSPLPVSGNGPKVFVPEMEFNFAPVLENIKVIHDFIVKNKGNAPLEITDVKPG